MVNQDGPQSVVALVNLTLAHGGLAIIALALLLTSPDVTEKVFHALWEAGCLVSAALASAAAWRKHKSRDDLE